MNNLKMEQKKKSKEESEIAAHPSNGMQNCKDRDCPIHGRLTVRGRVFKGKVTKKFPRRIVIEFERMIYIRKYERYMKRKTKLHARLPECMGSLISVGDTVLIKECRPLSKIIHFVAIKKVRGGEKEK